MDGSVRERKSGIMTIFESAFFKNQDFKIASRNQERVCDHGELDCWFIKIEKGKLWQGDGLREDGRGTGFPLPIADERLGR